MLMHLLKPIGIMTDSWTDGCWHFLRSRSAENRSAGILIMIRKHLLPCTHIASHSLIAGRLVHNRLHLAQWQIQTGESLSTCLLVGRPRWSVAQTALTQHFFVLVTLMVHCQ